MLGPNPQGGKLNVFYVAPAWLTDRKMSSAIY